MHSISRYLVVAILLIALGGTAFLWLPALIHLIEPNAEWLQGLDAAISILSALGGLLLGWLGWRKSKEAHSTISTNGGDVAGRDKNVTGGDQSVVLGGSMIGSTVTINNTNVVSEQIWKNLQRTPTPDLKQATERYLQFMHDKHRYLNLKGLGIADKVPLRLELVELYVPLKARLELPSGDTWQPEVRVGGRKLAQEEAQLHFSEPQEVLELLKDHAGVILLGDPGAGKSTFLKYLAVRLACGQGDALGLGNRLPVLLPLAAYANALQEDDLKLDEFIHTYFNKTCGDLPVGELLRQVLEKGEALVLLDGLDEVKDAGLRHTVIDRALNFYNFHRRAGNKFVLTSRIIGYREVRPSAEDLIEATLVDFDEDEIELFVAQWSAALEKQAQGESQVAVEEAEKERRELLEAIGRNPGVRALAANPLLLTILAVMKRQGVTLPERRVELYDQYVRTMVSSWNRARNIAGRPVGRDLDVVQTLRILAPLALWMHEVNPGVGLVRREDLRRRLEEVMVERRVEQPEAAARRFLEDVHDETALLLERGPGDYGFIHLTLEEYLAAAAVALSAQQSVEPVVACLSQHIGDPAWREVSLLAVGHLGIVQQRDQAAGAVVEALIETRPGPVGEAVVLAGEAVLDARPAGVPTTTVEKVIPALIETMQTEAVPMALRRRAGLALGRLGWSPPDLDEMVEVPAGSFLYGDEKRPCEIPYRYWIAKYPVSNSQFARFMQAGGYQQEAYWSPEGWKWLQGKKYREPRYYSQNEFGNPIFPVVGVSWYEAEAFCSWLSAEWKAQRKLPEGYGLRLPTEEEWERAARGTDGREYPWGDWAPGKGNIVEENGEGIGTTAVCTFPGGASANCVLDMSGNAWEWTITKEENRRICRGGSWHINLRFARCAFRCRHDPVFFGFDDYLGFRYVLSSAFLPF